MYIAASLIYWLFFFPIAKYVSPAPQKPGKSRKNLIFRISCVYYRAQSIALVLVFHFLQGGAGSVGATIVGGSLSDIWKANERGPKMAGFALCAVLGTVSQFFIFLLFPTLTNLPLLGVAWLFWYDSLSLL